MLRDGARERASEHSCSCRLRERSGPVTPSPVVKYSWDAAVSGSGTVASAHRSCDVVILTAFKPFAKGPNALQKGAAVHAQTD